MSRQVRPICVPCAAEMFCVKNGYVFVTMADLAPYEVHSGDMWQCPTCGHQILSGFGTGPLAQHFESHFGEEVTSAELWVGAR